jgi:hypothetical protein
LDIDKSGKIQVIFKHDIYQPVPGFKGTTGELQVLKEMIKEKILDFIYKI